METKEGRVEGSADPVLKERKAERQLLIHRLNSLLLKLYDPAWKDYRRAWNECDVAEKNGTMSHDKAEELRSAARATYRAHYQSMREELRAEHEMLGIELPI